MPKKHALRPLPYASSVTWALCSRHVKFQQIAAFDEGVTCKDCRKILEFRAECERERERQRASRGPEPRI